MNPFISFCLYVSARVFVQYLKSRPDDSQTADALRFLLSAMNAIKRQNPLTESFLVQLDVDIEALLIRIPKLRNIFPRTGDSVSDRLHYLDNNCGVCQVLTRAAAGATELRRTSVDKSLRRSRGHTGHHGVPQRLPLRQRA